MLNGANKTTFDIARISTSKGNVSKSLTATISLHRIFLSTTIDTTSTFSTFFPPPFSTNTQSSHFPSIRHTHAVVSKNNVLFFTPRLHFFSPPASKNYLYNLFFPNEILHKLTSCHFIFQNKNVERFIPKNTSLFTSSSTIVQFIREQ